MSQWRVGRWALPVAVFVAVLVAIPLAWHLRSAVGSPSLWTDRPAAVTPTTTYPDWTRLARELKPAVVNISTKRTEAGQPALPESLGDQEFFQHFFGTLPPHQVSALGSGFVINPDGYIVTNNHVVDGATTIRVKLADGREFPAKIVGRDPKTDLTLLKVDAKGLAVIPLGDSSALQVAEPVMAIGNPFGLEQTVTTGIVSATGRVIGEGPYDDFIQTDAAINPGNSGGPLINSRGQAVGVNTAIFSQSGGSVGIGFAIPINLAKPVLTQLAANGHVVRGWLGVSVQPLTPDLAKAMNVQGTHGALVSAVLDHSPAQKAGLKPGDVITAYDGRPVGRLEDLPRAVADTPAGREVQIAVLRDGTTVVLMAKIARLEEPTEQAAAQPGTPRLGLSVQPLTPALARDLELSERQGLIVQGVEDGSPAADVGLRPGDVIVEIDHQPAKDVGQLQQAIEKHRTGSPILMRVRRGKGSLFVAVAPQAEKPKA
jgi:serine protease Do